MWSNGNSFGSAQPDLPVREHGVIGMCDPRTWFLR